MITGLRLRTLATVACLVALALITGCSATYRSSTISFDSQGKMLSGVLNMPAARESGETPLVVFVHGDGPLPADAFGYNSILWARLAEAGIASLSWDKQGVGGSEGDWLAQSMDDRAQEVVDALDHIVVEYPGIFPVIGLIGWSQAGWVVPEVVYRSSTPDFMIMISGAVNWKRQGEYMTRQRLLLEGSTEEEIEAEVRKQARDGFLFEPGASYSDYVDTTQDRCTRAGVVCGDFMSEAKFDFATRNRLVDATERLEQLTIPTLALFGDHDRNVDYRESFDTYQRALKQGPAPRSLVKLYQGATHSLLDVSEFDTVVPDAWWLVKLAWQGEDAFVDGVLDDIVAFVLREAEQ